MQQLQLLLLLLLFCALSIIAIECCIRFDLHLGCSNFAFAIFFVCECLCVCVCIFFYCAAPVAKLLFALLGLPWLGSAWLGLWLLAAYAAWPRLATHCLASPSSMAVFEKCYSDLGICGLCCWQGECCLCSFCQFTPLRFGICQSHIRHTHYCHAAKRRNLNCNNLFFGLIAFCPATLYCLRSQQLVCFY